jgi:hypothetical protein
MEYWSDGVVVDQFTSNAILQCANTPIRQHSSGRVLAGTSEPVNQFTPLQADIGK